MPKRPPTPPTDEEHKYLIIHYPYPLHADMNEPNDVRTAALWIACVVGSKYLYAIYYKPKSPNLIVIEVEATCPNIDIMLGAHRWSEILKDPSAQEKDIESRCYYCFFTTGRLLQKNGWKRIDVPEYWFRDFSPNNKYITYPYPKTHYCDIPPNSQSDYSLCRPLPTDKFPRPKIVKKGPTVGSDVWVDKKLSGAPVGSVKEFVPATPTNPKVKSGGSAWSSVASIKTAASAGSAASSHARTNVWADQSVPHATNSRTINAWTMPPPGLVKLAPPGENVSTKSSDENQSVIALSERSSSNTSSSASSDNSSKGVPPEELFDFEGIPIASLVITDENVGDQVVIESLWDTDKSPELKSKDPICEAHGRVCKKGICRAYARQLKQLEREKNEDKGSERGGSDRSWRDGRGRGRGGIGYRGRGNAPRDNNKRPPQKNTSGTVPSSSSWTTVVSKKTAAPVKVEETEKWPEEQDAWDRESVTTVKTEASSVWGVGLNNNNWSGGGW